MKLLLCPKGYKAIGVKGLVLPIECIHTEKRGYALVRDDIADKLLSNGEGYERVSPSDYPGDLKKLYENTKRFLDQESFDDFINGVESNIAGKGLSNDTNFTSESNVTIPTPVFIPTIWTTDDASNYPVTITYGDTQGNPTSFVFMQDDTIRPCWLCRIMNWIKFRVFRKGLKSS